MPIEFPSRVNAVGRVEAGGESNARGATVERTAPGEYTITLERGLAVGWGACFITPVGFPVSGAPIVDSLEQSSPTTFIVAFSTSPGSQHFDNAFFFLVVAIDESQ